MFEADPFSVKSICNIDKPEVDELMGLVVAKGFSSCYDLSDICLSAVVGVQVEEGVEILYLCKFKGGILGNDRLGEDLFLFVLDDGLTVDGIHGYIDNNII